MSDITGVGVSDILGLSQPLQKLIECVSCGIGKVYEPTNIRRLARAKAEEIRLISAAVNENLNLPSTYINGAITVDASHASELMQRTGNRWLFQEMEKQQNIESVIGVAYSELEKENTVSEEPVDKDWILRFFNSVEDISNEEMQKLWGRVLAGEIRRPRSFSLRTLNMLRSLSQYEANEFQRLSAFLLYQGNTCFLPADIDITSRFRTSTLFLLRECGLISYEPLAMQKSFSATLSETVVIYSRYIASTIQSTSGKEEVVKLSCYPLTEPGTQLFSIVDMVQDNDYFIAYLKTIQERLTNCLICAYRIIGKIDNDTFKCEQENLLK